MYCKLRVESLLLEFRQPSALQYTHPEHRQAQYLSHYCITVLLLFLVPKQLCIYATRTIVPPKQPNGRHHYTTSSL